MTTKQQQTIRSTARWLNEYLDDCDDKLAEHAVEAQQLVNELWEILDEPTTKKQSGA